MFHKSIANSINDDINNVIKYTYSVHTKEPWLYLIYIIVHSFVINYNVFPL